jgi:hypothetical protein
LKQLKSPFASAGGELIADRTGGKAYVDQCFQGSWPPQGRAGHQNTRRIRREAFHWRFDTRGLSSIVLATLSRRLRIW